MRRRIFILIISFIGALPIFSQNVIKRVWSEPYVVHSSDQVFSFQIEVKDNTALIDEFSVDLQGIIFQEGVSTSTLIFKDDGTLADVNANDGIYTASNLTDHGIVNDELIKTIPYSWEFRINSIYSSQQGELTEINSRPGFVQTWFNGDHIPTVYVKANNFYHTTHVANIVDPELEFLKYDKEDWLNTYFSNLPDDRHSMAFVSMESSNGNSNSAQEFTIANDVTGIGLAIRDFGDNDWTDSQSLESVINFFGTSFSSGGTFLHELLHRFELSLPAELMLNAGGHYKGINSLHGHGFGGGFYNPIALDDGTFNASLSTMPRGKFNPLDMYLCGYGPIDDIPFPIEVLPTFEYIKDNPDGTINVSSNDTIFKISKELFLEKLGEERSPNYLDARKEQRIGLIVLSQRPLTPEEFSFYHHVMVEHEKKEGSIYSPSSYFERTHGVGELNTQIFSPLSSTIEPGSTEGNYQIFPNPSAGVFHVAFKNSNVYSKSRIYNVSGQLVKEYEELNAVFDMSEFDKGIYFIQFVHNGKTHIEKFILLK